MRGRSDWESSHLFPGGLQAGPVLGRPGVGLVATVPCLRQRGLSPQLWPSSPTLLLPPLPSPVFSLCCPSSFHRAKSPQPCPAWTQKLGQGSADGDCTSLTVTGRSLLGRGRWAQGSGVLPPTPPPGACLPPSPPPGAAPGVILPAPESYCVLGLRQTRGLCSNWVSQGHRPRHRDRHWPPAQGL